VRRRVSQDDYASMQRVILPVRAQLDAYDGAGALGDLGTWDRLPPQSLTLIQESAAANRVPWDLYQGLVWAEGGARAARRVNSMGAAGYAQLTRSGSAVCGVPFRQIRDDRDLNVACGAYSFAARGARYGETDPILILAMYNTREVSSTDGH